VSGDRPEDDGREEAVLGAPVDDDGDDAVEQDPDGAARAALERARRAAGGRPTRSGGRRRHAGPSVAGGATGVDQPYSSGRDPVPVGSTVDRLLADRGWTRPLSVAAVIGRWREVVGDHLADHCRPETFDAGALVVRADSTAWAMQVRLLVPQLERRLAEEVGEGVVESITVLGPGGPTWRKGPRSVPGRGPRDTYG
jgi:predicted nucleic acid-binding Zn ribbon protein